jgi:hypothetical protein
MCFLGTKCCLGAALDFSMMIRCELSSSYANSPIRRNPAADQLRLGVNEALDLVASCVFLYSLQPNLPPIHILAT